MKKNSITVISNLRMRISNPKFYIINKKDREGYMTGYLVNFAVYTMAMLGLIFFALMIYKKFTLGGLNNNSKSKLLSIEETISLAPRKTLYVVRAGNEKFLIAGDIDKTTLISKLEDTSGKNMESEMIEQYYQRQYDNTPANFNVHTPKVVPAESKRKIYENNNSSIEKFQRKTNQQQNVLHDMLRKING